MLAELDRDATVARLAAGKAYWRGKKRVEGRHPYGRHPLREFDGERAVVARIQGLKLSGVSHYAISKMLNTEGTTTRYGKEFTVTTVTNILRRTASRLTNVLPAFRPRLQSCGNETPITVTRHLPRFSIAVWMV